MRQARDELIEGRTQSAARRKTAWNVEPNVNSRTGQSESPVRTNHSSSGLNQR
jgi:hypothetical protein